MADAEKKPAPTPETKPAEAPKVAEAKKEPTNVDPPKPAPVDDVAGGASGADKGGVPDKGPKVDVDALIHTIAQYGDVEFTVFGLGGEPITVADFRDALGYPHYGGDKSKLAKAAKALNKDTPDSHRLCYFNGVYLTAGDLRKLAKAL